MRRLVVIIALGAASCWSEQPSQGRIAAIDGDVLLLERGEQRPAAVGEALRLGQALLTGASSRASIALRGGHAVEIEENSVLALTEPRSPKAIGTVLERGSARVTSPQTSVILEVGTPFGLTEIGGSDARVELNHEHGMTVEVGEVLVHTVAGSTAVSAGQQFTVTGIVINLADESPAAASAPPKASKRDKKRKKRRRGRKVAPKLTEPETAKTTASGLAGIRELVLQGEYTAAEGALDAHLNQTPTDAQAWTLLGDTHRKMRRWSDAVSAYAKAASHGAPMLANRARFLAGSTSQDKLEDHDQAAKLFESYLRQSKALRPLETSARVRLANSLLALGKRDAAQTQLRKVVTDYPKSPEAQQARRLLGE